jgi:SAM-dependent methyltransferase
VSVLKQLVASVRDFGLVDTLDRLPAWALAPLTRSRLRRRKLAQFSEDGFDEAHGTDTAAILVSGEQGPGVSDHGHVVSRYETSSEEAIRLALDSLVIERSRFTFIDLGCGKGKPLMVAATYGFRRLVGVDISPACIAAARDNIARYGPQPIDASRIELRVEDTETFAFPDDPLVLYLFNPFPQAVLERVLANLEDSLRRTPREAAVVYMNPTAAAAVARSALFERVPTIADRMPLAAHGVPAYQRAAVFVHRLGKTGQEPPSA